jgi:hypothetical protein
MATTTNFGWETPDDTDLVKDGAAAMRTLGNSIDTSFVDLKGGTTGQVLAKASNTDLDFTWAADASGIPATIFDAKGDLIAATAADTAARLAVGTNGQYLTADSTATTGLKWSTPGSTAKSYSLLGTGTLTGATTITVSGISGMDSILVLIIGASIANASGYQTFRINGDTGNNYDTYGAVYRSQSTWNSGNFQSYDGTDNDRIYLGRMGDNTSSVSYGFIRIDGCNSSGTKIYQGVNGMTFPSGTDGPSHFHIGGVWNNTATVTSISAVSTSGNWDAGTFQVWGSA